MLYSNPYAFGLDFTVEAFIKRLYQKVKDTWSLDDGNCNGFGRVARNKSDDGYVPQYYNAATKCYVSGTGVNSSGGMFFEDTVSALFFMGLVDPIKKNAINDSIANMQLIFCVNLEKITAGGIADNQGQRLDDVAVNDIANYIQAAGNGFEVGNIYKDVDKVWERYSGAAKRQSLNNDLHPKFCFRIDLSIPYNPLHNLPKSKAYIPQTMWRSIVLFTKTSPNPNNLIAVGNGRFIQAEYAPGNTLTPMRIGDSNGYLAGRKVQVPFTYNNQSDATPVYDNVRGIWDRSANAVAPQRGFNDGDISVITFFDTI